MATSGSFNYSVTAQQIVIGALRALGVADSDTTPTTTMLSNGLEALEMLIKQLAHNPNPIMRGLQPWHRIETTIDTSASGARQSYTLAPSGGNHVMPPPLDILSVVRVDEDGNRTPMTRAAFETFTEWDNRTNTGTPVEWYYRRNTTSGTLYFDVIPDDTTVDFVVTYIRPLMDVDSLSNNVEFPSDWYRPLKYLLAGDLAPEYQIEISKTLSALITNSTALVQFVSPETSDLYFQPGAE